MKLNIVTALQERLAYPVLHKIDTGIQDIQQRQEQPVSALIAQAAIPAVLAALYSLSRNEPGATRILNVSGKHDSLVLIFSGKENLVADRVALYAEVLPGQALSHLQNIARETIRSVREWVGDDAPPEKLKAVMDDQRHNILVCLPPFLNMGELLKDDSLDDDTHKMEGPVSDLMHAIEKRL